MILRLLGRAVADFCWGQIEWKGCSNAGNMRVGGEKFGNPLPMMFQRDFSSSYVHGAPLTMGKKTKRIHFSLRGLERSSDTRLTTEHAPVCIERDIGRYRGRNIHFDSSLIAWILIQAS